jgi:signal transduction histidine kinase
MTVKAPFRDARQPMHRIVEESNLAGTASTVSVLLVEDSPSDAALVEESLNHGDGKRFAITRVERLADALDQLRQAKFDVLLVDLSLPDSSGRDTFLRAREHAPHVPIVVMTGVDDENIALDALRQGIQDYLVKRPGYGQQALRAIRYAIERKRLESALQRERDQLEARVRERTAELSDANQAMQLEIARRQQAEEAHQQVLRRLNVAEETERGRISRELHDRLGQDLTALKLGLQSLQRQCPFIYAMDRPPGDEAGHTGRMLRELSANLGRELTAAELVSPVLKEACPFGPTLLQGVSRLKQLTDGLMQDIHRLAWELHPRVLDDLGLDAALRRYTAEWSAISAVTVDFHSDGMETRRLPLDVETALYRVVQEALNNVLRHAKARRVSVLLECRADRVSLIVEDDGVGFDPHALSQNPGGEGRLGLVGMHERVRLLGGALEVESTLEHGSTIFARIPLDKMSS